MIGKKLALVGLTAIVTANAAVAMDLTAGLDSAIRAEGQSAIANIDASIRDGIAGETQFQVAREALHNSAPQNFVQHDESTESLIDAVSNDLADMTLPAASSFVIAAANSVSATSQETQFEQRAKRSSRRLLRWSFGLGLFRLSLNR